MVLGSTTLLELLTPFRWIFVTNCIKGRSFRYLGPHSISRVYIWFSKILPGGPIIIHVHLVSVLSLLFSTSQLTVPSLTTFWPSLSSSNARNHKGLLLPSPQWLPSCITVAQRPIPIYLKTDLMSPKDSHLHMRWFQISSTLLLLL